MLYHEDCDASVRKAIFPLLTDSGPSKTFEVATVNHLAYAGKGENVSKKLVNFTKKTMGSWTKNITLKESQAPHQSFHKERVVLQRGKKKWFRGGLNRQFRK